MNKITVWLTTGMITVGLWACGGRVVVDAGGNAGEGGAGGLGQGGESPSTSSSPAVCGDVQLPSPASLTDCTSSGGNTGGVAFCATCFKDPSGTVFETQCSGEACACSVNGTAKCSCAMSGADFCGSSTPCCPWIPIPL